MCTNKFKKERTVKIWPEHKRKGQHCFVVN